MLTRIPLFWLAVSYLSGIILEQHLSPTTAFTILTSIFATLILYTTYRLYKKRNYYRNKSAIILLILCIIMSVVGVFRNQQNTDHLNITARISESETFSGEFEILHEPELFISGRNSGRWKTQARIISLNGIKYPGNTRILLNGRGESKLLRADTVKADYVIRIPIKKSTFPQGFSRAEYLRAQGVSASLLILGDYQLSPPPAPSLLRYLELVRAHAIQTILKYAPEQTQGFLAASIFGYRKALSPETEDVFRSTGIGHILAISGLHVGLIILLVSFICTRLNLSPRRSAVITIAVCLIFLILSGGRSAVLRASIIAIIYLCGILIFRKSSFINSLGAAALLICLLNPLQIYDIGFQLSFISVTFISVLTHRYYYLTSPLLPPTKNRRYPFRFFIQSIPYNIALLSLVTISAWLGILPLSAYYFKEISLIGFAANLLVIPLMPFAVAGGLLLQLAPLLPGSAAGIYSLICAFPASAILSISKSLSTLPVTSILLFPPGKILIFIYYSLFAILLFLPQRILDKRPKLQLPILISIVMVITLILYSTRTESSPQTDSITLIRSKRGESAIIRGKSENQNYTILLIQEGARPAIIIDYLNSQRIKTIDALYYIHNKKELSTDYETRLNVKKTIIINDRKKGAIDEFKYNNSVLITTGRIRTGRIVWYCLKNNNLQLLTSNWHKEREYEDLMTKKVRGYDSPVKILRINGKEPLSSDFSSDQNNLIIRDKNISNSKGRKSLGIIRVTPDSIVAWTGDEFIDLSE